MFGAVTSLRGQHGVSLIETLVVVSIVVIVATLALTQRSSADAQFQRQNVARELKVAFERARFDSVKRRAEGATPGSFVPATVIVDTGSYTLNTDSDRNGTYETLVTNLATQNITIAGYGAMTLPVTVTFNKRGEASAVDGGGTVNPQFLICNGTCPQTPTSGNANIVLVTPTGTVNLLAGNATPPTFVNANVTSVPTGTNIRDTVSLP
jgi:prepilin-type N-terminal cleavage/methylation domain-containing protein